MEPPDGVPPLVTETQGNGAHPEVDNRRRILWNDQVRCLFVGNDAVKLSPLEYRLALLFITHMGQLVSYDAMIDAAFSAHDSPASRAALLKHLDRIRSKLRTLGLDLPCVTKYGCMLIWEMNPHSDTR